MLKHTRPLHSLFFQDIVRYSLLGDATALEYFYVTPDTGNIYLRRSIINTQITRFTVSGLLNQP